MPHLIEPRSNWQKLWMYGLTAFSLFLVLATFLIMVGLNVPFLNLFRGQLHLGHENNVAAWFSGMLFFSAGVHAFDGFIENRGARVQAAIAWLIIAIILLGLSLDEVGSLHERADNNIAPLMYKTVPLLPIQTAIIVLVFGSMWSLWKYPEYRKQVVLFLIGCAVLATVHFQERLENVYGWGDVESRFLRGLRLAGEEGTELLGALIIIRSCLPNSQGIFARSGHRTRPVFDLATYWSTPVTLVSLFLLVPGFTLFSAFIGEENTPRGYPASWLAGVLFMCAGIAAIKTYLEKGKECGQKRR